MSFERLSNRTNKVKAGFITFNKYQVSKEEQQTLEIRGIVSHRQDSNPGLS